MPHWVKMEKLYFHILPGTIDPLSFCKRPQKGTGDWQEDIFFGPPGHEDYNGPEWGTGGQNNYIILLIAITIPEPMVVHFIKEWMELYFILDQQMVV